MFILLHEYIFLFIRNTNSIYLYIIFLRSLNPPFSLFLIGDADLSVAAPNRKARARAIDVARSSASGVAAARPLEKLNSRTEQWAPMKQVISFTMGL